MPVDERLIRAHASYRDEARGISERFVHLDLSSGSTVGILSAPLGSPRSPGWVMCHSYGHEHTDLLTTEGAIARRIAAAGFPVLRFHCQGYGESEHPELDANVDTHLRDTADVLAAFPSLAGVERTGLIGTSFGATVAALAADQRGIFDLVLVAPVVSGRRYMDGFLRALVMAHLARSGGSAQHAPTVEELRRKLERDGVLDHRGHLLTTAAFQANGRVDLLRDLRRFAGRVLLVQVSASERPQRGLAALADRLRELGADVHVRIALTRHPALFGQKHVVVAGRAANVDALAGFHEQLAELVAAWTSDELREGRAAGV